MKAAVSKIELEADMASRFGDAFRLHEKSVVETLSSGIDEIDVLAGGLPRGSITEIFGPASSGRTSLMYSMLAYATAHEETCALVDTNDVFAPTVATEAGIDFDRLLWIRCAGNLEHAFKATDLLLHAGGFGLVILDLGDVAGKEARRIISSWWYRFRRTVEDRPTVSNSDFRRSLYSIVCRTDAGVEGSARVVRKSFASQRDQGKPPAPPFPLAA